MGSDAQRAAPAFTAGGQLSFPDGKEPEEMNGHWLPGFSFDLFTGSGQKGKVLEGLISYLTGFVGDRKKVLHYNMNIIFLIS